MHDTFDHNSKSLNSNKLLIVFPDTLLVGWDPYPGEISSYALCKKKPTAWLVEHCSLLFTVQCYRLILGLRGAIVNLSKARQIRKNAWHF